MRVERTGATVVLLTAVTAVGACDDGTGPEIPGDALMDADVAAMVASAAIEDVETMRLVSGVGGGLAPRLGAGGSAPFVRERTVTFLDADGGEMDGFDPLRTASVRTVVTIEGSRTDGLFSASVFRHRDVTVSGLEGEETTRIWNGTGTDELSRTRFSDEFGDRSYELSSRSTISNVVVGVPRSENPYPLSGSITHTVTVRITGRPGGDVVRERTAVVTFDGTRFATVTVNGKSYEIDLADRRHRPRRTDRRP